MNIQWIGYRVIRLSSGRDIHTAGRVFSDWKEVEKWVDTAVKITRNPLITVLEFGEEDLEDYIDIGRAGGFPFDEYPFDTPIAKVMKKGTMNFQ